MHGFNLGSTLLVNAEVDSMGGVVDGGVGIAAETSSLRAAIEKAQAELRQEYDAREEWRKELEFLEKGGNPLDFKYVNAASVSVQSTSAADRRPEQFVTSEAKGSFALTASPHGDSVESSGRPGAPPACEPQCADNLLLFDGESEFREGDGNSVLPTRDNISPLKQSSQLDGNQKAKESGESNALGLPKSRAYKRRNRSRPNRDGARSSSNGGMALKALPSDGRLDRELGRYNQQNQRSEVDAEETYVMGAGWPECPPCIAATKTEDQSISIQMNGVIDDAKEERKGTENEGENSIAAFSVKGLDLESSRTQTSLILDKNNDGNLCNNLRSVNCNGDTKERSLLLEGTPNMECSDFLQGKKEKTASNCAFVNDLPNSDLQSAQGTSSILKAEEEIYGRGPALQNHLACIKSAEVMGLGGNNTSHMEATPGKSLNEMLNPPKESNGSDTCRDSTDSSSCDHIGSQKEKGIGGLRDSMDPSIRGVSGTTMATRVSADAPVQQTCSDISSKLVNKEHEDSILEEAQIIEAKRKRIAELNVGAMLLENRQKSHWDFVLKEMEWMANDFVQERLWKINAAAQICHRIAYTSRLKFEEQNVCREQKKVAHTMAKAITEFWHSAKEIGKEQEMHCRRNLSHAVLGYALRFLKHNAFHFVVDLVEAPAMPSRMSDFSIPEMSWEDHFSEENLFYTVPSGSMEIYRNLIESHLAQAEKIGNSGQEETETSICDASADNAYEDDEVETSTYYLSRAFEGSKPTKSSQKKRKGTLKSYISRSNDLGIDFQFLQCMENKVGTHPSVLMRKRPTSSLNVGSIPTKRVRTAPRQRGVSPFSAGTYGVFQGPSRTDASSGDTNSFQDDQSALRGVSQIPNSFELESLGDFEKQLPFDSVDVSKPGKKKKAKHLGSAFEQRWRLDTNLQNDQRDHSRKRLDGHQLESNGSSGLFGQHIMKKPKMMRPSQDNSFDNITPMAGSIPSPVASQMSNMSNPNKLTKIGGDRNRTRNPKSFKMAAEQRAPGSSWSPIEDQALIVLVHDMGPNWELVSDAINNTLQDKCMFRKPKECKERHKILMDGTAGDGADSGEDSGSSQPYPSTLPGIPKGSARLLFQQLQSPVEEDMIKSHLEKIIKISQMHHYYRSQKDKQDIKQIQPHSSHRAALSEACPNNLNGGPPLTPLDLCDTSPPSPDVLSVGYQSSHAGLAISDQGTVASIHPSGANSSSQGSPNMSFANNFSSPSGLLNASTRDGRSGASRSSSFVDEQQRIQQYNQMLSGRNIQQSSLPVSGAPPVTDRGVRMLPGGNGMGIMMNRSVPMGRPGIQGIAHPPMLKSGSMLASSMAVMPGPINMPSGVGSSQPNSMLRPREALNMIRPGQNPDNQRQMMVPELQMQVTPGNNQAVPPFGGLSSAFPNKTSPPPVQTYPHHQQQHQISPQQPHVLSNSHHSHLQGQNHSSSTQHQAYAMRIAKGRELQQRLLQQQQHHPQFAASNALMPHVQPQPQLPLSSSVQNSSHIQPQTSSASVSLPLTQSSSITPMAHQQKLHTPPQGLNRNPQTGNGGLPSQMMKQQQQQRQRQPQQQQSFQQSGRHHPQQRQQSQSQQAAKLMKGVGRGNMLMQQNLAIDPSLLNGLSTTPGSQSAEKVEQVMHSMQGQGYNHPVQVSKPLISSHSSNLPHPQQKVFSGPTISSSKQFQQMPSHPDNSNQGHSAQTSTVHMLPASRQAVPPFVTSSNHQLLQSLQKLANQNQPPVQRVFEQNQQLIADPQNKLQADQARTDQQTLSSSPQMGTTAMPMPSIVTTTTMPDASSLGAQWKTPEQTYESGMPDPVLQSAPIGSPPITNSAGNVSISTISQGLVQGQSSGSLPSVTHNSGAQWQKQQKSPLQPLSTPQPLSPPQQQQQSPQRQLPPGSSTIYVRTTNSRLE